MIRKTVIFLAGLLVGGGAVWALSAHSPQTPYAGQDTRDISSLSASDIASLRAGEGWGLAKPAELNGFPGPAHILELADELELTSDQRAIVQARFEAMNRTARELGSALVDAEAALDEEFRGATVTPEKLERRLSETEALRASLRGTHLIAHLDVTPVLTLEQTKKYQALRGYGAHGHGGH